MGEHEFQLIRHGKEVSTPTPTNGCQLIVNHSYRGVLGRRLYVQLASLRPQPFSCPVALADEGLQCRLLQIPRSIRQQTRLALSTLDWLSMVDQQPQDRAPKVWLRITVIKSFKERCCHKANSRGHDSLTRDLTKTP